MGKNLKGRTIAIIAVLVIFCYGIFGIPHGVTPTALKASMLERINLGLDLKGGTRLVLLVHVQEAVGSTTDRDVERLQEDLQKIPGASGTQVHKLDPAHPEVITLTNVPANQVSAVRSMAEGSDYSQYDVASNADGSVKISLKPAAVKDIENHALQQSLETINDRINSLGVSESQVAPYGVGENQLVVEMPGVADPGKVEDAIHSTSKLAIYPVVTGQGPWASDQDALTALGGVVPPDDMLVHGNATPESPDSVFLLQRMSIVEGTDFRDAQPSTDVNGRPNMSFTLTTDAGNRFYTYTSAHSATSASPGSMAIVLGGKVKEVASINSAIRDRGEIEGTFSKDEVQNLSMMLRTGALPATIDTLDTFTVGPSLGAESIRQGVTAAIAGMVAVMLFMLVYYRGAGINADLALVLNLVILLGFMGFVGGTLTLPGIAGVILTIGMGVDSNVLIFERIREEMRGGKTAAAAVQKGFGMTGALVTIVDTHVTTIVSAGILYIFGTGPVRGFALTLTFGLLANLFTSVFVSRTIFDAMLERNERGAELSI
ncbi:MAG TPA: protein translocase subunit SecD [Acidobacteriaceae bacterium]|nr:protein translocase subunit SecD [Acidobacteriaceae bacterium]